MDIKSIIDAEPSTSTPKRSGRSSRDETRYETRPQLQTSPTAFRSPYGPPPPVHHTSRDHRPPQPPPLQPPGQHEFRSPSASSFQPTQSPYQKTPTSALANAPFPFPQHPNQSPYGTQGSHYVQRDSHAGGIFPPPHSSSYPPYGQSTPLPQTPTNTTPGSSQAYHSQARPPSSHSVTTPTSTLPQAPTFPRQSPSTSHVQIRGGSQSYPPQQYLSQPSTPLGPPANFARSGTSLHRDSPGIQAHSRTHSGGSHSYQSISAPSSSTEYPGSSFDSPSTVGRRQQQSDSHRHSASLERERSLSVSPKTRLPSQPTIDVSRPATDPYAVEQDEQNELHKDFESNQVHNLSRHPRPIDHTPSRSFSLDVNGILNAPPANEHNRQTKDSPSGESRMSPQVITPPRRPPLHTRTSSQSDSRNILNTGSTDTIPVKQSSTTLHIKSEEQSLGFNADSFPGPSVPRHQSLDDFGQIDNMAQTSPKKELPAASPITLPSSKLDDTQPPSSSLPTTPPPPPKKRGREDGVPVYAQSTRKVCRNPYLLGIRPVKSTPTVKYESSVSNMAAGITSNQSSNPPQINGHPIATPHVQMPVSQPLPQGRGPLGPWEPSILNIIPYEEITKAVSDFLFTEVVLRNDVGVVSNHGVHSQDAVLEIEAKIGQIIDKNTNDRLRIPVMSECVLCRNDPSIRPTFKSSMTEAQHKTLNVFLNEAFVKSLPPKASKKGPSTPHSRVDMKYKHTYECDTFYTLSQQGRLHLPRSIQEHIDPRNGRTIPKVRVTINNKTGELIAQIIKVRVADMDIYSPKTLFDWRISVNLEMKIDGDLRQYIEPGDAGKSGTDRSKDRLSYKHQQYQIDLTQVSPAIGASQTEKEHELEIEVASQEIRNQGQLARDGQPNQYEELVKGFVDNVRILVRHCKQ